MSNPQLDWPPEGFRRLESSPWEAVVDDSVDEIRLFDWMEQTAERLAGDGTGRGQRHEFVDSPDGDRWFVKQYHHGGMLAEEGDTYYQSSVRFYDELRGTIRADRANVRVPDPIGVVVRSGDRGVEGYYLSKALDGSLLSRVVRLDDRPDLLEKAGETLARLHDAGIDHRDYHVKNCLVTPDDDLVITDFDPVSFWSIGDWARSLRIQRFNRSLDKYGFRPDDAERFRRGYQSAYSLDTVIEPVQKSYLAVKNTLSDCRYAITGNRRWEAIDREKILVRVPNWLGDGVMCLPFLRALKSDAETGRVDVVVRSSLAELYRHCPDVDGVREIEDGKSLRLPEDINDERYSMAVTIPKSYRTAIQLYRSGIPRRLGFKRGGRGVFLTDRVPLGNRDREIHHAKLYLELLEEIIEVPGEIPDPRLEVPGESISKTTKQFNLPEEFVTIHPGSAYGPAKRWPPDKFNDLISKIIGNKITVVALGVPSEQPVADEVLDGLSGPHLIDLVGETSLAECMAVLKQSDGTVANDSGIMHLSSALGIPTVGIFGSSSPELTSPIGPRTEVLYENVECSPCFERECPLNDDRYRCLTNIQPEEVYGVIRDLVNEEVGFD